jgi:ankyrin repeat protein
LHLAIKNQHFLITKFLLDNGAKLNLEAAVHLALMPKNKRSIINENVYTALGYSAEILYFLNENEKKTPEIKAKIDTATKIYDLID